MVRTAHEYHALIFAPHGRDALIAQTLLREISLKSKVCSDLISFEMACGDAACFAVVAEEGLLTADLRGIANWIAGQPSWSDFPFIVLTRRGGGPERNPAAARLSEVLGNVTFLERPFHPTTFVSVARTALKGRLRQYDARARIEELHEGEERLRTALLAGRLGSWQLDLASWTLTCSQTGGSAFGFKPDQPFTYEDFIARVHIEDLDRMQAALRKTIVTGSDYVIEIRNIWPDNSIHWAEIRARLVLDRTGGGARLVGVSSDITDRKAAEVSLRQLNETLEARVAMRTMELENAHRLVLEEIKQREKAEEQLRQVQKMETIGQLSGGVAHDFNNLLMAVLGNLELLRKYVPDDPKISRLINGALQGAQRGAALTQRLLAFARQQDLKLQPVDLAALVRGMTELIERSVGHGINVRSQLPNDLPPALADANQLEMALLNLTVNARDAMPDGGTITIELDCTEPSPESALETNAALDLAPGTYLRLAVTDTGQGMDRQTLQRAIDPFFSTKEHGKGTGLGLSMIHGLAVQLNGALRLTSQPGKGTRAELWLPASTISVSRSTDAREKTEDPSITQRATILFVDDDELVAMSTVDMLQDLGHKVIEAGTGENAVSILKSGCAVDLLITDYSMPGMTGVQLAKAVQKINPGLPVLLATGYADLPKITEAGLPRLGKPYRQEQLAAEIAKILQYRTSRLEHS